MIPTTRQGRDVTGAENVTRVLAAPHDPRPVRICATVGCENAGKRRRPGEGRYERYCRPCTKFRARARRSGEDPDLLTWADLLERYCGVCDVEVAT